jgi:hypothetical protein
VQGVSPAHAPSGATLVGSAYGAPASSGVPEGLELVGGGIDYVDYDEDPDRCQAETGHGRCKNSHKKDSHFCGIHKSLEE